MEMRLVINNLSYFYDNTRKGSKYLIGGRWSNHGEYLEAATKLALGYEPEKDSNTAFNKGYDIPELKASVKSNGCSLTSKILGDTMEEAVEEFFRQSLDDTQYIWTSEVNDDVLCLYIMNNDEFRAFVEYFGSWEKNRKTVRIKRSEKRIRKYMENCILNTAIQNLEDCL